MPRPSPRPAHPHSAPLEVVHPVWLLKAVVLTILGALVCGYLTLCILFYQGQWQLILHPRHSTQQLTTLAGLPAMPVNFDAAESGFPRLDGALVNTSTDSPYAGFTVLYLRGGDDSLSGSAVDASNIAVLHAIGLNVFAFDYRGFGNSDAARPNQLRMTEDAAAALRYLHESRGLPYDHILLFGSGVGASLAVTLATAHRELPAIILDSPGPAPLSIALNDPRTHALPVRALFHERFPLDALATLSTPKLLISYPFSASPAPEIFKTACDPKITLELAAGDTGHLAPALKRFLDQYLPAR